MSDRKTSLVIDGWKASRKLRDLRDFLDERLRRQEPFTLSELNDVESKLQMTQLALENLLYYMESRPDS